MLCLKRAEGEKLILITGSGERIEIVVNYVYHRRVMLAIDAPKSVNIYREEILPDHLKGPVK